MGKLLFDLVACQSSRNTMNHGGKEYGEAVFFETMKRDVDLVGLYNPDLEIEQRILDYFKEHGELINIKEHSLQDLINTGDYCVFYSPLPYNFHKINWGKTVFVGNLHGLRPVEAFTDKYEYKYSNDFKSYIKAKIKSIKLVERKKKREFLDNIGKIINNPSFVCITGSEHSKFALLNYYPAVSPDNIAVFYDPLEILEVDGDEGSNHEKYYLLVSGNRWLKNTYRGIVAIDQLISAGLFNSKVIVTGTIPNMRYLKEIKNKESFVFKSYVSSSELASLYKNAYCLVFLSLSEGFGYPPLEAISRGTPVVCSPLTALYEVYQNAVLYCNPFSIEDIKVKILEMEDSTINERYVKQGIEHGKRMIERQEEELPKLVDYILSYCK